MTRAWGLHFLDSQSRLYQDAAGTLQTGARGVEE